MKYDISVILPAYNVGPYIQSCLSSLFEQTFEGDVEIIVIDDKSTDNTLLICEPILQSKKNCVLIKHGENQGCSAARNSGLDHASGTYIMFVDPDDTLPPGALKKLYGTAIHNDFDIVKGNHFIIGKKGATGAGQNTQKEKHFTQTEVLSALLTHKYVRGHPWGKLFKRSVIGHTRFKRGIRMGEDLLFCAEVFSQADSLSVIPETVYNYYLRGDGATGRKYITGAYLDWIQSIISCREFATTRPQNSAFISLAVLTLLQLAREARTLPKNKQTEVIHQTNQLTSSLYLSGKMLLESKPSDLATLYRYARFKKIKNTITGNKQ